ncbi:hypothetical protein ACQI4F_15640 [Mycolicibacterium vaccae]|uniref:hypothetical protein n=1 Tax=Mycolicibacterium vaccae TaxID=1810 RepID=UPI003CF9C887
MSATGIAGMGAVVAAAVALAGAPNAQAQPPPNAECTAEQQAAGDQECKQQQPPGLPDLQPPRNPNDVATQPGPAQQPPPQQGDLADTNCWVVNGVPRWNAPGTAPAPASTTDIVEWCPTKYGLTPRPPR